MDERRQQELRILQDTIAEGEAIYGELTLEEVDRLAALHVADLRAAGTSDLADRFLAAYDGLRTWTTPEEGEVALETFQRVATEARLWLERDGVRQ